MNFRGSLLLLVTVATTAIGSVVQGTEAHSFPLTTSQKQVLIGWSAETFSLPPGFAPTLPKGTESLRFAPGWRKPGSEDFWSYAFVMWIDEPVTDPKRVGALLESYYRGLLAAQAEGEGKDVSATPAKVDIAESSPRFFAATIKAVDAFGTYKPITVYLEIESVPLGPKHTSLRVKVSPQPKNHPIWKSLQVAIDDILANHPDDIARLERAVVELAIRKHLKLPEGSTIHAGHLAKITQLDLSQHPITDSSLKWISSPATGFSALKTLNLQGTQVTDAGVISLARASTGLKKLSSLMLASTSVTDVGLRFMSSPDSGLKNLITLDLRSTLVTNNGVIALSRADTGLKELTTLDLSFTKVTDEAIKHLSRSDTGVRRLATLGLASTQVADSSLISLAKKQTGLKALRVLNLAFTQVSDGGIRAASGPDTGLSKLKSLFLYGTRLTNSGVRDLAGKNSGLTALSLLDIGSTALTDVGLADLARSNSGLKSLAKLHIRDTNVTETGVSHLKKSKPKLDVIR